MKPCENSPERSSAISVSRMRESDKYTIEHFTSGRELMRRAAQGIFDSVNWNDKKTAIVCGSGNNGGDGYALSCILAEHGFSPVIFTVGDKFSEDGRYYYEKVLKLGVKALPFSGDTDLSGYDIIADCILGTGFHGTPRGIVASAIEKINNSSAYVVSADINSGLDGDTGSAVLAVKSDLTVSIGFYKTGMFQNDAPKLIGDLINVDIGIKLI